uniref:Uncharacterized protein n=1 Tax=Wuchereria bancrofti TaxID=6293 RepID=A0AAF5PZV9_WUCBA
MKVDVWLLKAYDRHCRKRKNLNCSTVHIFM